MPPKKTAKKKPAPKKTKMGELKVFFPEQLDVIYTNHSAFVMTPTELTIDLGVRHGQVVKNTLEAAVHIKTRVMMSPQHAKVFLSKMKSVLKAYEEDFGKIITEPKKK